MRGRCTHLPLRGWQRRQPEVDDRRRCACRFGQRNTRQNKKRLSFAPILQYVRREGIQCVYIRSYHNANPFTIHFVRMLKKQGVRVLLEIPTYPYDHEYSSGMEKVQLYTDKLFRHAFCRYVDFIVTFSSDDRIFGRPTIRISTE